MVWGDQSFFPCMPVNETRHTPNLFFYMLYKRARTAIPVFEYQHKVTALSLDFILIKSMSCFFLGSFKNQALKFVFKSVQSQSLVQKMSRKVWFFQI